MPQCGRVETMRAASGTARHGVAILASVLLGACGASGPEAAGPTAQAGAGSCPGTFDQRTVESTPTRGGDLVPSGASTALLCVYPLVADESAQRIRLGRVLTLTGDRVEQLVSYLNGLSEVGFPAPHECTLLGHDQYQVVLNYYPAQYALLRIDFNCGLVSSGGAVRQVGSMATLIGFWPDV
jgi:hypothetical protein